ncbi:MAG TPA: DUF1583 domain-containing protein, partial [Planctomycetaceae bacterium]|nr:DUF1583 domain-containing protein [Planctomycetaceae bacterium]
ALELNHQKIYEDELEPANRRTFGLFHYSDQTELTVRNIVMRGDWPKSIPNFLEQELADPALVEMETQLVKLPPGFQHDFVRDGLPEEFFKLGGNQQGDSISAKSDGVHIQLVSAKSSGWTSAMVMPQFSLSGDFDVQASFELRDLDTTFQDGLAFLEARLTDRENHYFRSMRGRQPDVGQSVRSQVMWGPLNEQRRISDEQQSSWETSGRLRMTRVGKRLFALFAPEDSQMFRILREETITDADVEMGGILLELAIRDRTSAHVVWKDVSLKAERLKYLPPSEKPLRILSAMNADGSNLRSLTEPAFNLSHLGSPEFSTDGSKIVLDMSTGSTTSSHIVLMNRDGTELQDLGMGCMPSLSKDRKSIVFSVPGEGVVMMDLDGENRKTIDRSGWGVQFSPDGKQIAYGRSSNITLMDVATNEKKPLMTGDIATRYSSIYWNLGWSHDSRAIAFKGRVRTTGQEELAVVALDKPDAVEILYSGSGINPDFTFSPDNQDVLFAKNTPGQPGPQLYLAHRKTPGEIEFLKGQPTDRMIYDCEWSPDGREIVFSSVQIPVPVEWPIAERSTSAGQNSNQP